MTRFSIGVDLAAKVDWTAIAVLRDGDEVPHLARWRPRSWSEVIQRLLDLEARPSLQGAEVRIGVDVGGPHAPEVLSIFRAAPLRSEVFALIATSSPKQPKQLPDGRILVSKRLLVAGLVSALPRLRLAQYLELAAVLANELRDYRQTEGPDGRPRWSNATNRAHDDLVSAMQLAVWTDSLTGQGIAGRLAPLERKEPCAQSF